MPFKMKLSVVFIAVVVLTLFNGMNCESTDIELDRKAQLLHKIDSLVSKSIEKYI